MNFVNENERVNFVNENEAATNFERELDDGKPSGVGGVLLKSRSSSTGTIRREPLPLHAV